MNTDKLKSLLTQALAEVDALTAPPLPTATTVKNGQSVQAALDAAEPGATILVEPGSYQESLTFAKPVTLRPTIDIPPGRAMAMTPVIFYGAAQTWTITGNSVKLMGIGARSKDSSQTIVFDTGQDTLLDRVSVLGDQTAGQHRGIAAHGKNCIYRQIFVDNCFLPARDAQGLSGWDGTDGLVLDDSYVAGGAESVMFGGADPSSEANVPKNIVIRRSTLSKNPAWYPAGAQIKCAFELKDATDVLVQDTILEYAGISGGSTGFIVQLTPRNPGNTAPYSSVQRIQFNRVLMRYGGGGVNMMGQDDTRPSGPLSDVTFEDVVISDLDPLGPWKGQGRVFTFNKSPRNVTLDGVTASGTGLSAAFYFIKAPIGLKVRNIIMPVTKYGIKVDGGGSGWPEVLKIAPDTLIDDSVSPPTGATGAPKP